MSGKIMTVRQLIDALSKCYGGEFVAISASDQDTGDAVTCAIVYEIDYHEPSDTITLMATTGGSSDG